MRFAIGLLVAGLLGILITVFVVFLFTAIIFNMKTGERYRSMLANKLVNLRLNKMLGALGVDVNTYLHNESIVDIQNQMARCTECENTDQCDDRLSNNEIAAADIDFCNNEKELQEIVRKHPGN